MRIASCLDLMDEKYRELEMKVSHLRIFAFILEVIRPLEDKYYDHFYIFGPYHLKNKPIRMFVEEGYENIVHLIHTIPIYLCESKPKRYNETDIIDLLGAYFPNTSGDSPYIELYLPEIDKATQGNYLHFKWLFTKVLLHELAHAALDIHNNVRTKNSPEKVQYWTTFGKWREESMANAVALRIIKEYGDEDFYEYAKQFMLSQPPEYALGVLMEDFDYWDFRSVTEGKEDGVNQDLQDEWLVYVKGTPDWEGLEHWNDLLTREFVYVFEAKKYTSEEELVYDIVTKVLSNFETKNGRKMRYSEFKSIFPYIRTGAEMSYEKSDDVKNDSRFKFHIQLEDENCSLYCNGWDNETLHKFIANTNIDLKEYKNH